MYSCKKPLHAHTRTHTLSSRDTCNNGACLHFLYFEISAAGKVSRQKNCTKNSRHQKFGWTWTRWREKSGDPLLLSVWVCPLFRLSLPWLAVSLPPPFFCCSCGRASEEEMRVRWCVVVHRMACACCISSGLYSPTCNCIHVCASACA